MLALGVWLGPGVASGAYARPRGAGASPAAGRVVRGMPGVLPALGSPGRGLSVGTCPAQAPSASHDCVHDPVPPQQLMASVTVISMMATVSHSR